MNLLHPIAPLLRLWSEAWRRARLLGWTWARHDLQLIDATHPDLPMIVRRIAELER